MERVAKFSSSSSLKDETYLGLIWSELKRNPSAVFGAFLLVVLTSLAFLGPFFYATSPTSIDFSNTLAAPSRLHPFGTNMLGQDMLARIMHGGRISLLVGIFAMFISILVGTTVGMISGFHGGKLIDNVLMRITDLFLSMPNLPLLMLVIYFFRSDFKAIFGPVGGTFVITISVIGLISWMPVARLVRAGFLTTKENDYVKAAYAIGASNTRIVLIHILPNVLSPVIVAGTFAIGSAILTESVISFLGLGFPPDTPTWGSMLNEAKNYLQLAPHIEIIPGLFIFLTVLSINALGDGLRDALDPQQRRV